MSACWIVFHTARRWALALLFLACLQAGLTAGDAFAESLAIRKDANDNIRIILDPALITKIHPVRENGQILINVPPEHADSVSVDSVLKNAAVVDVQSTSQGKQILIHTDAVYWDMKSTPTPKTVPVPEKNRVLDRPLDKKTAEKPNGKSLEKSEKKTALPEKKVLAPSLPPIQKAVPQFKSLLKTKPSEMTGNQPPIPAIESSQQKIQAQKIATVARLRTLEALENNQQKQSVSTTSTAEAEKNTEPALSNAGQKDEAVALMQTAKEAGAEKAPTPTEPVDKSLNAKDEESLPLQWDSSNDAATPASLPMEALWRMIGSLVIVLGLLIGFMKFVLPKLMANGFLANWQMGQGEPRDPDAAPQKKARRGQADHCALRRQNAYSAQQDNYAQSALIDDTYNTPGSASAYGGYSTADLAPPPLEAKPSEVNKFFERQFEASLKMQEKRHASPPKPRPKIKNPLEKNQQSPEAKISALLRSSQHALIARMGESAEGFHILSSSRLGKNKELHLVEIQGRQMVLATTPYSVNLVTEIAEGQQIPLSQTGAFLEETARQVAKSDEVYKKYLTGETMQARQQTYQHLTRDKQYTDPDDVLLLEDYDDVFH